MSFVVPGAILLLCLVDSKDEIKKKGKDVYNLGIRYPEIITPHHITRGQRSA
jgi:hypothetical protein